MELKSELSEDLSGLKNKVLKKITYLHGGVVTDIAKEFYQIFHAKLEKITPGCINMEFILEAKNTYDAKTKIEEMRKRLEIKLQDIIKDEHGRFTTTIANRSLLSRRYFFLWRFCITFMIIYTIIFELSVTILFHAEKYTTSVREELVPWQLRVFQIIFLEVMIMRTNMMFEL